MNQTCLCHLYFGIYLKIFRIHAPSTSLKTIIDSLPYERRYVIDMIFFSSIPNMDLLWLYSWLYFNPCNHAVIHQIGPVSGSIMADQEHGSDTGQILPYYDMFTRSLCRPRQQCPRHLFSFALMQVNTQMKLFWTCIKTIFDSDECLMSGKYLLRLKINNFCLFFKYQVPFLSRLISISVIINSLIPRKNVHFQNTICQCTLSTTSIISTANPLIIFSLRRDNNIIITSKRRRDVVLT